MSNYCYCGIVIFSIVTRRTGWTDQRTFAETQVGGISILDSDFHRSILFGKDFDCCIQKTLLISDQLFLYMRVVSWLHSQVLSAATCSADSLIGSFCRWYISSFSIDGIGDTTIMYKMQIVGKFSLSLPAIYELYFCEVRICPFVSLR